MSLDALCIWVAFARTHMQVKCSHSVLLTKYACHCRYAASRPFKCVHRLNWPQHILPSLEELAGCACDCKWQSCYDVNSRTRTESDIHSGWKSDLWKCDIKRFPLYSLSSSLFPLPLSPSLSGCLHTDITLFTRQVSKVKTPSHTAGVRPL